jgi:hypothetical protein
MNINSLYGSIASMPTTTSTGAVSPSSASISSIPPPIGGAATASISTPGQFLSQMQELSQQNPTEFKAVAAQVATSFQNAASQASGSQAQFLTNLANQFSQAAQTGSLQPPQGAQSAQAPQGAQGVQASQSSGGVGTHHHHHHGGGGGSMSQSSDVQQAFLSAMSILTQATQGASASASSVSSAST